MTSRQAQNTARALCSEHGEYRLVQVGESWHVVVRLPDAGEDFPSYLVLRSGDIYVYYAGDWRLYPNDPALRAGESYHWRTERPQGMEEG